MLPEQAPVANLVTRVRSQAAVPSRARRERRVVVRRSPWAVGPLLATLTLVGGSILVAPVASADVICGDTCVVDGGTVDTPLGQVTVSVTAANVVTVTLSPTAAHVVLTGVPVAIPPGPPTRPGYSRASITTSGGVVNIDTVLIPPGPPDAPARPDLAIVSIHPPSPCRVNTSGFTVTFTPIIPPGPPV